MGSSGMDDDGIRLAPPRVQIDYLFREIREGEGEGRKGRQGRQRRKEGGKE